MPFPRKTFNILLRYAIGDFFPAAHGAQPDLEEVHPEELVQQMRHLAAAHPAADLQEDQLVAGRDEDLQMEGGRADAEGGDALPAERLDTVA